MMTPSAAAANNATAAAANNAAAAAADNATAAADNAGIKRGYSGDTVRIQ